MFFLCVPSFLSLLVSIKQNKYINYLIIKTIIIIIITLWESFPARVLCVPGGVCVPGGSRTLVKTFTSWQELVSWQVLEMVSEAERYWGMFFAENNGRPEMATFDNS